MDTKQVLLKYWGYSRFRPLQEDVIQSILNKEDSLALMPTGGGKSICYQVPALMMDGICIVVSPLIALMKDQVENLKGRGIKAASISSALSNREIDVTLDNCIYGDYKFLFLSPERLGAALARERIAKMNVNLIAVDEAHCISQWGFDFRPAYRSIASLRNIHPQVPVLALTATATKEVVADIQEQLLFKKQGVHQISFERKNLSYQAWNDEDKIARLIKLIKKNKGSGIVYVRNRRRTQELTEILRAEGISCDYYHAGLDSKGRSRKQEGWMSGKLQLMIATNAFGMGIDHPNVRLVVHMDIPDSPESYFQEAGRAGRDGRDAVAAIICNGSDTITLKENHVLNYPPIAEIKKTYQALANYFQLAVGSGKNVVFDFDLHEFCSRFSLKPLQTYNALKILEREGYFVLSDSIHYPSRIHFSLNKERLYGFQVEHKRFDPIIKLLLRSYAGLFDGYVKISEQGLKNKLGLDNAEIKNILTELDNLEVLSYVPQSDSSRITFLTERVEAKDIIPDRTELNRRMKDSENRMKFMLNYVSNKTKCRSQMLLEYFGEQEVYRCGVCDHCLTRNKLDLSNLEFETVSNQVKRLLHESPMRMQELVQLIEDAEEKDVVKVIRWLVDNDKVIISNDQKLSWIS